MVATPSPNYFDQQLLAAEPVFISRVKQSLIKQCNNIKSESPTTVPFHRERETFVVAVMNQVDSFKATVAAGVATDTSVINDATVSGATPLTSGNVAAQALLITDAHIDNAISAQMNTYFRTPGS